MHEINYQASDRLRTWCRYATALVEARKKKGMTRSSAIDQLKDVNYFGTMMVKCGDADGMVSGAAHTTAATIRPGLQVRLLNTS